MLAGRAGDATFRIRGQPRPILTLLCLLGACAASLLVALLNGPWFALVNGFVDAREAVPRGLLFSSWLVVVGGGITIWRPRRFGVRPGEMRRHWRLILGMIGAGGAVTALVLKATGAIPYSDDSLVIESVVVPVTEEIVFRAVLLTALIAALERIYDAPTALILGVVFNGLAFGLAHLANMTSLASSFVIAQALFACVLGMACAYLMARTRSVYPAIGLHAVVNAVVVIAS